MLKLSAILLRWMFNGMVGKKGVFISLKWFIFACIFLFVFCISISASDNVETDIEFEFIDGVQLNVEITVDVNSITIPANGVTYKKSDIHSLSTSNPEMMGAIKISIKGLVSDQLQDSFPDSVIVSLQELPTYSSGVFIDSCTVSFLPSFYSLNASVDVDSFVNGFLDCGAFVNYSFTLKSYTGWNQSYTFTIPQPLGYKRTNGDVNLNQITWEIKTIGEPNEKDAQLTLLDNEPTSPFSENESMHVQFILDCTQPDKPVLTIQFQGFQTLVSSYDMIPEFISNVKSLPADAMRLFVLQNLTSWTMIKNQTFDPAYFKVKPFLENSSFNQNISSFFSWVNNTTVSTIEPFNVSHMDINPPITANYSDDSITFTVCNISSRAFFGLINAGAHANITKNDVIIGDNLESIPYTYSGTIMFPDHVMLNNINDFNWDNNTSIEGSFSSTNASLYSECDISTSFMIDVKNTDLNLLSFFTGRTELSMGLSLTETQHRNVTEIPFQFSIPEKINIPYVNSDAFRVCVEEQVFTNQQLDLFTSYHKDLFHSRSKTLFPLIKGSALFDQSAFDESLMWNENISLMDNSKPVIVSSSIQTAFPLMFDFSILPPSASIQALNLSFSGIKNQDVTYSMIFPKGIRIDISDTFNRAEMIQYSDGRMGFSISFNETDDNHINSVLITMHPSGLYLLAMFVPCIISIFITMILLILVYIIRKKRKGIRKANKEIPHQEYDQEDYYVPPPPSKRK